MAWMPSASNVIDVHNELTEIFAQEDDPISPPGVKTPELLESACARPLTSLGEFEKYQTLPEKAAALFHSLTKNHAFHNGNKRTALVSMLSTLHRNDCQLVGSVTDDDVYELAVSVTADAFPKVNHGLDVDGVVQELASWIRANSERLSPRLSSMTTKEFIKRCEQAGARSKPVKGGSLAIMMGARSVKIARSTRRLDGNAVRKYIQVLNLSESSAGITGTEFQGGVSSEREQIYRFISALRRLAKT